MGQGKRERGSRMTHTFWFEQLIGDSRRKLMGNHTFSLAHDKYKVPSSQVRCTGYFVILMLSTDVGANTN